MISARLKRQFRATQSRSGPDGCHLLRELAQAPLWQRSNAREGWRRWARDRSWHHKLEEAGDHDDPSSDDNPRQPAELARRAVLTVRHIGRDSSRQPSPMAGKQVLIPPVPPFSDAKM